MKASQMDTTTTTGPRAAAMRAGAAFAGARVIAVGRAGADMARFLRLDEVPGFTFAAVDTDPAAVRALDFEEKLFIGSRLTRGLGAGGDPDLARAAADEEVGGLRELCEGHSLVFLLAGLGGGSGTGVTPVVARAAREVGASVFALVTLPFACEGSRRDQQARAGLHRLKTVADGVLCLPNQRLLRMAEDRATLMEVMATSRRHIRDAVVCLWGLLTRPGMLSVSFADLCSVLRGPNLETAFGMATASGPDRAVRVLEALLEHPLLSPDETLRRAESVLVRFAADASLEMGEIRTVMEALERHTDGARVVVGASTDEDVGGDLTVSVMVSTRHVLVPDRSEEPARPVALPPSGVVSGSTMVGLTGGPGMTGAVEGGEAEGTNGRPGRRWAPPPPDDLTLQETEALRRSGAAGRRGRRKPKQAMLPFEVVTRGRFEKCEPTIRDGQNLDQPTFLRRGITLN
jgi:cell division protein FtsZ